MQRATSVLTTSALLFLATARTAAQSFLVEQQELWPQPLVAGANFGSACALEGDTLLVGASGMQNDDVGRVHVYRRASDLVDWTWTAQLIADDSWSKDGFAASLDLSDDTAVVGAWRQDSTGGVVRSGAAYAFERAAGSWAGPVKLAAPDAATDDLFGWDVAVDGDWLVVSAPFDDDGAFEAGAAWVFQRVAGAWQPAQKLLPSGGGAVDDFGWALALQGERIVVGSNSAVTVFETVGGTWMEVARLVPDGFDWLGVDALALDGDTLAFHELQTEQVHVWRLAGGVWTEEAVLPVPAWDVALGGDVLVAGDATSSMFSTGSGAARVYGRRGGDWTEIARLFGSSSDSGVFGARAAVQGTSLVVTDYATGPAGPYSGAAYSFVLPNPGRAFGEAAGCPCGNDPAAGSGEGCVNSRGWGGILGVGGLASASADRITFGVAHLPHGTPGWLFRGAAEAPAGTTLGDGLLCVSPPLRRVAPFQTNNAGVAVLDPGVGGAGAWTAGVTYWFQAWYRDPSGPCGSGFSLTSGTAVTFGS